MKICLYFEKIKMINKSGVGRALKHQQQALEYLGIDYTLDYKDKDGYDVLHINTIFGKSMAAIKHARKIGAAVIYHGHTTVEDFQNSFILSNTIAPLVKRKLIKYYGAADLIITPTVYSKQLITNYGLTQPIYPISNGVDLKRFKKDLEKEKKFREFYNLKDDDKVVISVGLWIKRKGILDFVEIAEKLPNYKFIWFGSLPLISIPNEIKKVVKNPPENVIMAGYVSGDIIEGAFSGADVFFFPSHEETEGIVVLEALASSQLILARDIPVYSPWLEDGINCYLAKNNEQFIDLINKAINKEIPHTGIEARKLAEIRDIKLIAKQLEKAYLDAIEINKKTLKEKVNS